LPFAEASVDQSESGVVLKIRSDQIVRTSAAADIELGGGGTDQVAIGIERVQKAGLIGMSSRLDSLQRAFIDEK
jgi:hypothetical protein